MKKANKGSGKKKGPNVEVIILTHNGKKNIEKCLASLKKSKYGNLLITVIDQKGSDGTAEFVEKNYPSVNLIRNKINKSFSAGNNDVLRKSKAKYCFLLNDDTEVLENTISQLVDEAEKDSNIASLQPKILDMKNKKKFEYAGASGGFIDIYGYPICRGRIFDHIEEDKGQYDDSREIFWSCGVAMLMNLSVAKKIGYLDEDLGSYAEELDWCWRAKLSGHKIKVVPEAKVYHLGSGSWGEKKLAFKKDYLLFRNHFLVMLKNYERKTWKRVVPMKIILEKIAFLRFLFSKPRTAMAIASANLWILRNSGKIIKKNEDVSRLRKVSDEDLMKGMVKASAALQYPLGKKKLFRDFIKYLENY